MQDTTQQTKSVLVIDDEESLLNVLSQKFSDEGIIAYVAHNGREGLQVALEKHPDLILLDIMMPEMDGFDVMKHLQEDEWGKTVPVILLTNSSSIDTVAKAVSTGMSEFLVKTDLRLDEVVDKVKERFAE
jgi:two-component system alkaline phosphatase synthesis response regulator PhoP